MIHNSAQLTYIQRHLHFSTNSLSTMHITYLLVLLCFACLGITHCASTETGSLEREIFYENLHIKALPQQYKYLFLFNFTSLYPPLLQDPSTGPLHYGLFPRSLAEILQQHGVHELHLSLTQSVWRYGVWGPGIPQAVSPIGAQLVAWIGGDNQTGAGREEELLHAWGGLVHSLGGMMCSSLHEMTETNIIRPSVTFSPWGLLPPNSSLLQGTIPREGVCTNNLTPFRKTLPCPDQGLSDLLDPDKLFDNLYHSLATHVYYTRVGGRLAVRLDQHFSAVFDTRRFEEKGFSLSGLFGTGLTSLCPLSEREESQLILDLQELAEPSLLHVKNRKFTFGSSPLRSAPFYQLLNNSSSVDPKFKWAAPPRKEFLFKEQVHLLVDRYTYSSGLEDGQMCSEIYNQLSSSLLISHLETVPWYFRVYTHTMSAQLTSQNGSLSNALTSQHTTIHRIQLARDNGRPLVLEMVHAIPPLSTLRICAYFQRAILHWTKYPPDAHHGFYVPHIVLRPLSSSHTASRLTDTDWTEWGEENLVYSRPLLISLATPDFSMPYNVLCLVCTAVGIGFALVYRLSTQPLRIGMDTDIESESIFKRIARIVTRKSKTD